MLKIISNEILNDYPELNKKRVDQLLQDEVKKSNKKIVVLDDDPTGVQTVHDISVFTYWDKDSIKEGFKEDGSLFYILTNSRSMTEERTAQVHNDIAQTVAEVADDLEKEYLIISRSDSTLRGHYPLETEVLTENIEKNEGYKIDGEIICPFFEEGGRYTINDIHYVADEEQLIPAAQTEFAKDKTFGYSYSDLKKYVEEKTNGKYNAADVVSISLEDIRALNIDKIVNQLLEVRDYNKVILNAINNTDIKVSVIAIYRAMLQGKHFIFRSGAALVKEIGGISEKPLLTKEEMEQTNSSNGGVVVVGSHTEKTTRQLEHLLELENVESIEFHSDLVVEKEKFQEEIERVVNEIEKLIRNGKTAVTFTNRKLLEVKNDTKEDALKRSVQISDGVQSLVGNLSVTPGFIVAKGGITSSDIGSKALQVKKANVMGQIHPGIPVWETLGESKFPHIPYVIFPGNTGNDYTLKKAVSTLV